MSMFDLTDRVAIVTGGSDGIGRGIANGLAEMGAHVAIVARQQAKIDAAVAEIRAKGRKAMGYSADVSQQAQVNAAAEAIIKEFGRVDILVNNAGSSWGTTFRRGLLLELEESDFDGIFATNVKSGWFFCKAVVPTMMQQEKGGVVINVSSVGGWLLRNPSRTMGLYSATKAAILSLTRSEAAEWAPKVRVNALLPGLIQTDRTRNDPNRRASDEELARTIGMGRVGFPSDLAGAACFLASDAAAWMTGSFLQVDGGPKV